MSKSGAVYYKNRKLRKENASLVRAGRKIVAERDALEMAYNEAADHADMLEGQVQHLTEKYEEQGVALDKSIAHVDMLYGRLKHLSDQSEEQTRKAYEEGASKCLAVYKELRKMERRATYYSAAFWVLCTVTAIITTIK